MGETQSVMLSSFGGTWLWGGSAAATRASSLGGEGAGGRAEPAGAATADAAEAAAAAGGGRGDFASQGDAAGVSRTEAREYVSYRLGRSTFIRTPIMWGVGRSSSRFDFGVSLRTRRVSASPERTAAATEAVQKESRKCGKDSAAATSKDEETTTSARQDATNTPDGPAEREFICSVCLELLWKPTVLDCGHSFCFWCAFQCMNVYDVSRCPLCKSTFDKFPPVSRPLDLFLLRHFPRTTKQRDKEMEEFESHRHRRSPCHSRIADLASGASTDALPAPQLQWLLEQKAPDLVRPAAAQGGAGTESAENLSQREKQESGPSCSTTRTVMRQEEYASSCQTGAEPSHGTETSTLPAVGRTSGCRTVSRAAGRRRTGGEGRARVPRSGERTVVAERGMLTGRRLLGGDRVRSPAYSEHSVSPDVRVSTGESRDSDWDEGETAGRLEVISNWQTAGTEVHELPRTSERRFSLRSETVQEFAASAVPVPGNINWITAADGARAGAQGQLVANDGVAAVTSIQRSPYTLEAQGNRIAHTTHFEESGDTRPLDSEGERGSISDADFATMQLPLSTSTVGQGNFASLVEPVHVPEHRGQRPNVGQPLRETSETGRSPLSGGPAPNFGQPVRDTNETGRSPLLGGPENTGRRQTASPLGAEGIGETRGDRAPSLEIAADEWDEWDGLDEGDVSLGLLDPGELTTGHRRNPGDEPLQPMDTEEEELSGFTDAVEEEFAFSGELRSTSSHSVLTESDPTRPSEAEDEVIRSADDEEINREAQENEENVALFQQHPAFNETLLTPEDFVHYGIHCDGCGKMPIVGRRHRCLDCNKEACGFDLCGTCKDAGYDKPGRFDQNHSSKHRMKLVQPRDAEWWIQSLNRMKKIHPELTIHQILQWILVHYQEMGASEEQPRDETTSPSRRESGRARAGLD